MSIIRPPPIVKNFLKVKLRLSYYMQQAICLFACTNLTVITWILSKFGCYYCKLRVRNCYVLKYEAS